MSQMHGSGTTPPPLEAPRRGEGVAVWRQVADALAAEIDAGQLAPGSRLPPESELAQRFGVNRHTLRRALGVLARQGRVRAQQGSGTYVGSPPLVYPITPRTRFSDIVSQAGREAQGELLSVTHVEADDLQARDLGLAPGASLLRLEQLHRADGVPISWARTVFPLPRFAALAEAYRREGSLTRAFAACGVPDYLRLRTSLVARLANATEERHLDLGPGRPVLAIDSINVDAQGVPIQSTQAVFAADRVEILLPTSG
jgi:GntR family phosphonate transport system transcriptional regulator